MTITTLTIRRRTYSKAGKKLSDDTHVATAYDGWLADRIYTEGLKEVVFVWDEGVRTRYTRGEPIVESDDQPMDLLKQGRKSGIDELADRSRQGERKRTISWWDRLFTGTRSFRKPAR